MADSADEDVCTLKNILEMEEDLSAVYSAGDPENCTYSSGYMERQPLFSCETCDPLHKHMTGVCLACAVKCHDNHEVLQLYTKRNFKCDCGNSKFKDFKCSLFENKDANNENNVYNHNFHGSYCTCNRPYPDPDDEIEDEMLQCIICEDWFHNRHLDGAVPEEFSEMICTACVGKNQFLLRYKECTDNKNGTCTSETENVEVVSGEKSSEVVKKEIKCCLDGFKPDDSSIIQTLFLPENWRQKLCTCPKCQKMYEEKGLVYLLHETDTLAHYERRGKEKDNKELEDMASGFSRMDRIKQVEIIHGVNVLKEGMSDFFASFPKDQVITKEHIEKVFEDLNAKRRRLNNAPPGTCR